MARNVPEDGAFVDVRFSLLLQNLALLVGFEIVVG